MKIAIVDIGTGNLRSVYKALQHVAPQASIHVSVDPDFISRADRVVFPGQGAMGNCMQVLARTELQQAIEAVIATKPFLGICLGLEALYRHSEEDGGIEGLGVLKGRVRRLQSTLPGKVPLKIPHMGWNTVSQTRAHPLWDKIQQGSRFYFVHSYGVDAEDVTEVAGTTEYGVSFVSAASKGNVFAVQFHPEKSQQAGLTLLRNFVTWDGEA